MRTEGLNGGKLSLTNNGILEVFFIGTGSAFAKKNYQTNLLIVKGKTHIMVDFGSKAQEALLETARLDVTDLSVFLPTHSHSDHIGGLECAGLMNRYVGIPFMKKPKLQMIISEPYQEILWDRSLRGGMEWNEEEITTQRRLSFGDYFNVVRPNWLTQQPRETWWIDFGGIHLELFRTKHVPDSAMSWQGSFPSFGLFIDGRIFFSGDTRFDPDLINLYKDRSEFMFHDVQFFSGGVHASLEELKTLPDIVKSKMLLVHYGDNQAAQNITGFAGYAEQRLRYIFD